MRHMINHRAQAWRVDQSNKDKTPRPAPGWIDATHGVPYADFVALKLASATLAMESFMPYGPLFVDVCAVVVYFLPRTELLQCACSLTVA